MAIFWFYPLIIDNLLILLKYLQKHKHYNLFVINK